MTFARPEEPFLWLHVPTQASIITTPGKLPLRLRISGFDALYHDSEDVSPLRPLPPRHQGITGTRCSNIFGAPGRAFIYIQGQ